MPVQRAQHGALARPQQSGEARPALGVAGKGLLVDVKLDEKLALAVRNLDGVRSVESGRLTARDLADAGRVVMTRAALERLQEVLG